MVFPETEVLARYASRAAAEAGHRAFAVHLFGAADAEAQDAEPWERFLARVERLVAETATDRAPGSSKETHPMPVDEAHTHRHSILHACLDELVADYLVQHPDGSTLSRTSVLTLMLWSHIQTEAVDHPAPDALASPPTAPVTGVPLDDWRPVADSLPPPGQVVLVRDRDRPTRPILAYWDGQDWLQLTDAPVWLVPLTDWRPLVPQTPGEPA